MAVTFGQQAAKYFVRPHIEPPARPVAHPAAWFGADFLGPNPKRALPVHTFSAEEVAELETVARGLHARGAGINDIGADDFPLPLTASALRAGAECVQNGLGFTVFRGLPVARWGKALSSLVCWGIGQHLGRPGEQNPAGERLGHVVDYGEEATQPMVRRYRTTGNIDFHCDGADAVGLLCLRTARSGGQSRIASSVTIFNELLRSSPALAGRLFEPMQLDRRDEEKPGQPPCTPLQPACFDGSTLRTFYHSEYFRSAARHEGCALDEQALAMLDAYDAIAAREDVRLDIWLQPGDLQLVSNHLIVHARTAYEDHPEAARKRHLLRLWLSFA